MLTVVVADAFPPTPALQSSTLACSTRQLKPNLTVYCLTFPAVSSVLEPREVCWYQPVSGGWWGVANEQVVSMAPCRWL